MLFHIYFIQLLNTFHIYSQQHFLKAMIAFG